MKKGKVMSSILALAIAFSALPIGQIPVNADEANVESQYVFDKNTFDSHRELERALENECIVLIKNDTRTGSTQKMLPLNLTNDKIAIFGEGHVTPPGGGGSSGIQGAYRKSLKNGLDAIKAPYFAELTSYIEARTGENSHGWDTSVGEWGENHSSCTGWNMTSKVQNPEAKYTDEIVAAAADYADTAVVYISRATGTEEMDRHPVPQPGDWYLNTSEQDMLQKANDNFDNVIVIFVGTAPIGMRQFEAYPNIKAFLIEYGAAQHHGDALAGILYGSVNPSGKLNDTLAYEYSDHPTSENFGYTSYADKGYDWAKNDALYSARKFSDADPISAYEEYIYMGYKYFDTFNVSPAYPFGFGLSYSDFEFSNLSISADTSSKKLTVNATITNTTSDTSVIAGKEVMQVYVSKPQGNLEQAYQNLIGFNKTKALASGETQSLTVTVPIKDLASYDEALAAYVLEAGDYIIRVGNSSRNTHVAGKLRVAETFIVEKLNNELSMDADNIETYNENRLKYENATPITYAGEAEEIESAEVILIDNSYVDQKLTAPTVANDTFEVKDTDKTYKFKSVVDGDITPEEFVAQFSNEELTNIVSGGVDRGTVVRASDDEKIILSSQSSKLAVTNGAGFSRANDRLGLPSLGYADGGSGIWFTDKNGAVSNTGWPRPAGFACSWNPDGYYSMGVAMGIEMLACNVDNWLAPAINMHRYPFGGRNLEYWSEDPVLTGIAASSVARGVAESGVTVCLKHFAANDQEWYRRGYYTQTSGDDSKAAINVIAPERVLREIYLKPFEMAVKTDCIYNIMSAFNTINGQPCAASPDLLTDILRGEWGFKGYVVTDWGDYDDIADSAYEMAAGNDMIMSGVHTRYSIYEELVDGLNNGEVTREELLRNVRNLVVAAKHSALATDKSKHEDPGEIRIATSSLPNARIGVDYTDIKANHIWANGSVDAKSYTFTLTDGTKLPEGMSLNGDGRIIGAPASGTVGKYVLNVKVEDDLGNSDVKSLHLTVQPNFAFTTLDLADAKVNTAYSQTISGKNYMDTDMALTVKTGTTLPTGLSFDGETISGTPVASGIYSFTILATDGTNTAEKEYTLFIEGDEPLSPVPGSIIEVTEGTVISEAITADVDVSIYEMSELPAGVNFENGKLSGMPQIGTHGEYEFIIVLTKNGVNSYYKYTLRVVESNTITKELERAKVTVLYDETINTGLESPVFTLASGTLPSGIELTEDGRLTGVAAATQSGIYPITVSVSSNGSSYTFDYELYVEGMLSFEPAVDTVFELTENTPFTKVIDAVGGTERFTFEITDGALPAGLNYNVASDQGSITINGTPTTAGIYTVVFTVDDVQFAGSPVTSIARYTFIVNASTEISVDSATDIIGESYAAASDGVTLIPASDIGGGENAVIIPAGESVKYNISVGKTKPYYFTARSAQSSDSKLSLILDNKVIGNVSLLSNQGLYTTSEEECIFVLEEGQHTLEICATEGEVYLNLITFEGLDDENIKLNRFAGAGLVTMNAVDYTIIGGNAKAQTSSVAFLDPPAYMYYYVYVKQPGNYDFYAKANGCGGGKFDLYIDGKLEATIRNTINTGYGGTYEYNAPVSLYLDSGYHMFKVDITQSGMNLQGFGLEYTDGEYPLDKFTVVCDDNSTFEAIVPADGLFSLESVGRGGYYVISADKEVGTKLEHGDIVNVKYGKPEAVFDKHKLVIESVVTSGGDYIITYDEDTMRYTVKPNITDGTNTVMGNSNYIKISFGDINASKLNYMKLGLKASGSMAKSYDNLISVTLNGSSKQIWGWTPQFKATTDTYTVNMNNTFKTGTNNYVDRLDTDVLSHIRIKCNNNAVMKDDGALEFSYVAFFETEEQANRYVYDPLANVCKLTIKDGDTIVYETNVDAGTALDSNKFASIVASRPGYAFLGFDVADGTIISTDTVVNAKYAKPAALYNHMNFALEGALATSANVNNDYNIALVDDGINKYARISNKLEGEETVNRSSEDLVSFTLIDGVEQSYTIGDAQYAAIGYRSTIEKPSFLFNYILNDTKKSTLWEPVHKVLNTSEFTNLVIDLHKGVFGGGGAASGLTAAEIIELMDESKLYGFKLSPYTTGTAMKSGETTDILYIAFFDSAEAAQGFVYDPKANSCTITVMDGENVLDTAEVFKGTVFDASEYEDLVASRPGLIFTGFDIEDGSVITNDTVINAVFEGPDALFTYDDFIVDGVLERGGSTNNDLYIEAQTDGTHKYARIYNKLDEGASTIKDNSDILRFTLDDSTSEYTLGDSHYIVIGYRTNIQDSPRFTFNYTVQSSEYDGRPTLWEPRSDVLINSGEFEKCVFDLTSGIYGGNYNGSLDAASALEYFNKSALYMLSLSPYDSQTASIRYGEYMDIEYIALFDSLEKAEKYVYSAPVIQNNPVTFYDEDGTTVLYESSDYTVGENVTFTPPVKDGKTFVGWTVPNNNGIERVTYDFTATGESKSYTALYRLDTNKADYIYDRASLDNTYVRLTKDKALTVAYIGGSVTVGAGASNASLTSWRALTRDWFKENYPDAEITEVNAGIGGTGSRLAAYRVAADVLAHDPDLVFVEFAINDAYFAEAPKSASDTTANNEGTTAKYYESLIRQIRETLPNADIIALFTTDKGQSKSVMFKQAEVQNEIAAHYGITSIDMGRYLQNTVDADLNGNDDEWYTYVTDVVHPYDTGYDIYANIITTYLSNELGRSNATNVTAHKLPDTYYSNDARKLDTSYIAVTDSCVKIIENATLDGNTRLGNAAVSTTVKGMINLLEGAKITVDFTGTEFGIFMGFAGKYDTKLAFVIKDGDTEVMSKTDISCGDTSLIKLVQGLENRAYTIELTFTNIGTGQALGAFMTGSEKSLDIVYGDVNCDSKVNLIDAIVLSRNVAGWNGYGADTIDTIAADVDTDGELTPADVTILIRHLANWKGFEELPYKN